MARFGKPAQAQALAQKPRQNKQIADVKWPRFTLVRMGLDRGIDLLYFAKILRACRCIY